MIAVDTNVLVRILVDDPGQPARRRDALRFPALRRYGCFDDDNDNDDEPHWLYN